MTASQRGHSPTNPRVLPLLRPSAERNQDREAGVALASTNLSQASEKPAASNRRHGIPDYHRGKEFRAPRNRCQRLNNR